MKRLIYLATILIIASCGKKAVDKKTELAELKKQRSEIESKIAKLESEVGEKPAEKVSEVNVTEVVPVVFKNYVEVQGKVDAEENVQVNPEMQGVVTAIYVKAGQHVSKGQVLAQIDDKVLRQNMAQLQTQLDLATNLFNRQKALWEQKIGTEVQYLNVKTQKEGLEKQMGVLRSQLSMYKIKSPISGTVDQMDLKIGQAVMPGASGIRVVNASDLKAKALVAETYASKVNQGDEVQVLLPDAQDSLNTRLTFVSKVIDPVSRSFNVEVKLPSKSIYRPNMLAVLKIVDYRNNKALTVPVNAIQKSESGEYVYIAENGKAKRAVIETGKIYDGRAEVLSGLKAGDKVVTVGFSSLNEGDTLKF
ncbi:efflux RND transporter periplasmic adaptor subunit [Rubrolithibacter danxiaensis]|uniref:efflux RND transporter periplasmic adaptor subunit n=1 Tax=Rubrolithibacter danxiaensis TaxID=3390805 RepID=UPI003BF8531B